MTQDTKPEVPIVCLVGSTGPDWQERYRQVNRELCLAGYLVVTVSLFKTDVPDIEQYRPLLERIHFAKMDLADVVVLIDKDAVGTHTAMEIARCKGQGKPVITFTTIQETDSAIRTHLAMHGAPKVRPELCEMEKRKITDQAYYEACKTHDYEWSECPFRPYSDRMVALEKRMAWRAIFTFSRRVDEEFIIPSLGRHYSADPDGKPYCYTDDPHFKQDESPSGLYPAIVVPKELIGKVVVLRPVEFGEGERL